MISKEELLEEIEDLKDEIKVLRKNEKALNNKISKQKQEINELKKTIHMLYSKLERNEGLLAEILLKDTRKQLAEEVTNILGKNGWTVLSFCISILLFKKINDIIYMMIRNHTYIQKMAKGE